MTTRGATSRIARTTAILLLGLIAGCKDSESKFPDLVEVPHPDITNLDKEVQEQLKDQQSDLSKTREKPEATAAELGLSYGRMGMLYHAYDLHEAAEACYRNAQSLTPDDFRWPYYMGAIYTKQGKEDATISAFKQALSIKPDDVPALVCLAQTYLEANKPEEAKPFFERAAAKDPNCAAAFLGLGKIASLQKDHPQAVKHCRSALNLQPDATAVHYVLAMAYRQLKQMERAEEHFEKCRYTNTGVSDPLRVADPLMAKVQALPMGMQRRMRVAVDAVKAGNTSAALKELLKAVKVNPDDPIGRINLGIVLAKTNDNDGAIKQFREAIRLRPRFARAHREWAAVLANKGDFDGAMTHFTKAVESDPELFEAHWGLAKLALVVGKPSLAITHSALAIKIDPRHVAAREGHVIALTKAGRHAEALASLNESRKVLPRSMTLAHTAARLWAASPDDSVRDGARAIKLARTVFNTYQCIDHAETLAMAFAEIGKYEDARKWQHQAITAATMNNRPDVMPRLKKNMALYKSKKPCRTPW